MPADFSALVVKYGYAATFLGTLVEGETVLVLSGIAAHRGYLDPALLFAIGAGGAVLTDNFFFALGRVFGPSLLARFPRFAPSIGRAHSVLDRFPRTAVIVMRFLYGTRTVGPALFGSGPIAWPRFLILDTLAAVAWSVCWVSTGYALAEVIEHSVQDFVGVGRWVLVGLGSIVVAAILILHRGRRATRVHSGQERD